MQKQNKTRLTVLRNIDIDVDLHINITLSVEESMRARERSEATAMFFFPFFLIGEKREPGSICTRHLTAETVRVSQTHTHTYTHAE